MAANDRSADNDLNQFFSGYVEENLRPLMIWNQFTDNRFEARFLNNRRVMYPEISSRTSSDGVTFTDGFELETIAQGDDRYGPQFSNRNRARVKWNEWKLENIEGFRLQISRREDRQTILNEQQFLLDEGAQKMAASYNTHLRSRFMEDANYAMTGHSIDTVDLTNSTGAALTAGTKVPNTVANGKAIINALLEAQTQLIADGMWSGGVATPTQPYAILPNNVHALLQVAAFDSGYNWEPIATQFARSNGIISGLFGFNFFLDPTVTLDTGTTRGTIVIGLPGARSGILAARNNVMTVNEGPSPDHQWHDEYSTAYEFDSKLSLKGTQRMYRIQLKAAA